MRKIRQDREKKKLNNSLDDFYRNWLSDEYVYGLAKNLSNKRAKILTSNLKKIVDVAYVELRVEDKHEYYTNLYNIYDMLVTYLQRDDEIAKAINESGRYKQHLTENMGDTIKYFFNYEPVIVGKNIIKKMDDCLYWLVVGINMIIKNGYIGALKNTDGREINRRLERKISSAEKIYTRKEKDIQLEIDYLDEILKRIKFARKHIGIIYSMSKDELDKKIKTVIKGALTRTEKAVNLIINEIEGAYI